MERQRHTCNVRIRLTPDEYARVRTLMEKGGYPTVSGYLRSVITTRRMPSRMWTSGIGPQEFKDTFNRLVYEVNKVGVNYNQVVASVQRLTRQAATGGGPSPELRRLEGSMGELMHLTSTIRDEFALIHALFKEYLGEQSPGLNPKP